MNRIRTILVAFTTILIATCITHSSGALEEDQLNIFAQNDILFYDPDECKESSGSLSVCGTNLPSETIEMLENANVKENAEKNMERYKYAEKETGLSWQIVAALHFREGGMGSDQSILNGEELYDHTNVDGQHVSADANEDAKNAAKHFIDMAKSVYNKDVLNDQSMDSLGYGFLAYNRGSMYKCNGDISYKKSPYVMNFYDDDHMHMTWISADSLDCSGNSLNSVAGQKNEQVGALAVLAYLCGEGLDSTSTSPASTSSSGSSNSVAGKDITWIGDSYSVQADNKGLLSKNFSGLDIGSGKNNTSTSYIQGSKSVSSGNENNPSCLTILQKIIDSNKLRPYLVFACGTNGGWSNSDVTKFTKMLKGKNTKAIVVTSKIPGNDYADSNNKLKAMVKDNDNIYLADWTTVYKDSYFSGDSEKIHPVTDPGYKKWVEVISDALSNSSGNGCTTYVGDYPQYFQKTNYTCGPASMAMLATVAAGKDIFESDVIDVIGNDRAYVNTAGSGMVELDKKVCEKYGCTVEEVKTSSETDRLDKMKQYLSNGYMIHLSGSCAEHSDHCPFSSEGHYIGIFALKGGDTVTVADPGWGNKDYSLKDIAKYSHTDAFSAIRGSGGSSCDNYCQNSSSSTSGMTESQAKKIAQYYNGPKVSDDGLPYGKKNCVSFSKWFIEKFTNLKWAGGDGKDVAHNLAVTNNLTEGTEPRAYAVFSVTSGTTICEDGYLCGHTGIVVAVNGDDILTVEAAYPDTLAEVHHRDANYFKNTKYKNTFTYINDAINEAELKKVIGN